MIAVPAIVILVFYGMNLPADLAPRKSCCVYVGVGGVGGDRVGDRVEIVGRYILPRYRKDIVQRDSSRHRCSRTRAVQVGVIIATCVGAGFAVVWHSQTTMPPESRDLPKWI